MENDPIIGSDDPEFLQGDGGNDSIEGRGGDDTLVGVGGNDTLRGEDGDDDLYGWEGDDQLFGGAGRDQLFAQWGNSTLFGGDGDDFLDTGPGDDLVTTDARGGDGDDFILVVGRTGGSVSGGSDPSDYDTLYLGWGDGETGVAGVTLTTSGATWGATTLAISGIERFEVRTGDGDDDISTGDVADVVDVAGGANTVNSGGENDVIGYQIGAANSIDGGDGIDKLIVTNQSVVGWTFSATGGFDDGFGSTATGIERLKVNGWTGDDTISGGATVDALRGSLGNDILSGGGARDRLAGEEGLDTLFGGAGTDALRGGGQNDVMDGGTGDDTLTGGGGYDTMTGGAGADDFIFGPAENGVDRITDFTSGQDRILYIAGSLGFGVVPGPISAGQFALETAVGDNAQFILDTGRPDGMTALLWDTNGADPAGGVYILMVFDGDIAMTFNDIILF